MWTELLRIAVVSQCQLMIKLDTSVHDSIKSSATIDILESDIALFCYSFYV